MERGRYESFPGFDPEREASGLENVSELSPEEIEFGRDFEAPRKFEDEDEKNRLAELDSEASKLQSEIDELSESISQATHQLAAVPLTPEQQALLDQINQLILERERTSDPKSKSALDAQIEAITRQLAALPVTDEQGALLDDILALMDHREKTSVKLQAALHAKTP